MSLTPIGLSLRDFYTQESARIEREFEAHSLGRRTIEERAALVDKILIDLSRDLLAADPNSIEKFCLVAIGGYGRRALFPFSDIDLLYLSEDKKGEARYLDATRTMSRTLWDLGLRASPTSRTLAECEKFHRDNAEFNVSVLDARFIAGDENLFARLHNVALPRLITHERSALLGDISELTHERHQKEGSTIFHLEPNLKNSPGGLRDYHVACWVALLSQHELRPGWGAPENFWPPKVRQQMESAFDFLAAARCFLHYRQERDDNVLSYELQAEAAARGIGGDPGVPLDPASWMRLYFRHARMVFGLSTQLLDEALPARASLRGRIGNWRSRWLHPDFSVSGDRLRLQQQSAVRDPERLLGLFEYISREGVKLSGDAEEQIREAMPTVLESAAGITNLWEHLRQILVGPYAADALRAMHSSGLLVGLFPEFSVIDSLVMRDFYHHYTVDAHSFMAIENIHRLRRQSTLSWERPFSEIFSELEQPELLFLSLLFHDVGKGMPCENHVVGSLQAMEKVFPRLALKPEEADTVRFLIRDHLAMSANLMRRDIFDSQTIRAFAEAVSTPERLKLLCLFTYADIRAVNPEALTPWKAESLWQLYVSTANYMSRSLDEERIHAEAQDRQFVERILPLLPDEAARRNLAGFLEGLPRRYVLAHSPEEVATHFLMAQQLGKNAVELRLEKRGQVYGLTLLATDRPFLFAGISGTLASWGMNIWKAEAFANASGIVVDTFQFTDPHSTLALNPSEGKRLEKNIAGVLSGAVQLETLMRGRAGAQIPRPKVSVPTQIHFDDSCSSHSTLMEIITQDRPGLLYQLSAALAKVGCNIEVALIDTEGQRAVDAFYLTVSGAKLNPSHEQALRSALLSES